MSVYVDPPAKIMQHVDRLSLIKAGQRPAPVNVEIDLSNRCSLGCEWCHFAHTHTRGPLAGTDKQDSRIPGGDLMDSALAFRLLEELHAAGVRGIVWSGGGEPTLHPDFNAIIERCMIPQGLYTHGGHVDTLRGQLLKRRAEWVVVSLDECEPEKYKESKGVDYFERACNGLRNLTNAEGNAVIGASFLIHKGNWKDITGMIHLAKSLHADYVHFRPTVLFDHTEPNRPDEDTGWVYAAIEELKRADRLPEVNANWQRFQQYADWNGGSRAYDKCYWSAVSTVITPNGKVWTCCNKREEPGALIGDASERPFMDVWSEGTMWTGFEQCRVMCRGHVPNLALSQVFEPMIHGEFI